MFSGTIGRQNLLALVLTVVCGVILLPLSLCVLFGCFKYHSITRKQKQQLTTHNNRTDEQARAEVAGDEEGPREEPEPPIGVRLHYS